MDHPLNTKRGGVCLYCKCSLALKVIDVSYLQERINFELKIGDKTGNSVAIDLLTKLRTSFGTHCKQKPIPNCSIK